MKSPARKGFSLKSVKRKKGGKKKTLKEALRLAREQGLTEITYKGRKYKVNKKVSRIKASRLNG